ncbi:uncharacterized protein CXQ87_005136 [Candidozyma duobushaemuli]|uniref:Ornithine cyclodeaminase n=1 Tax=Candidozyma duobushaemuli TaxID=1231522 RepID=A0A2V1A9W7_9ASCO|nr:uncharacterized protein CXQ87_005136 [[Candida] duobushaemulonis]PVH14860.1 hypothetical protein CXQ87_005136 [[Candida] duobushaemulonis]
MKILSDKVIQKHLLAVDRRQAENGYLPVLEKALADYAANHDVVPSRTVLTSNYPGCDTTHLFMPCAAPNSVGAKVMSGGSYNSKNGLGGQLKGVVNAKTLTAFRTALASFSVVHREFGDRSEKFESIVVFGTGPQAFWHAYLVLKVYGADLVTVVSRTKESAQKLCKELQLHSDVKLEALGFSDESVGDRIAKAPVILGCVPSTEPTIKSEYLETNTKKVITLIGSYKPHMVELDPEFVEKNFRGKVKLIVDSKAHALAEAGELVQSNTKEENLVSLNDYLSGKVEGTTQTESGITVAKIVGLSIMDIYMAEYMLDAVEAPSVEFD